MATGWAKDGAVQEQIDDTIKEAIDMARMNAPQGESLEYCEECGDEIPIARRNAIKGVRLCICCQEEKDKENQKSPNHYNRRGSKDSQLK